MMRRYVNGYPHRAMREHRRAVRMMLASYPGCIVALGLSLLVALAGTLATWDKLRNDPTLSHSLARVLVWAELVLISAALIVVALVALMFVAAMVWNLFCAAAAFVRHLRGESRPPVLIRDLHSCRMVPCFEKPVGLGWKGTSADAGYALAANCERLDHVADELHVIPLTDFGIDDDIGALKPAWRPARDGLRTVEALLKHFATTEEHDNSIQTDLRLMKIALGLADEQGIGFCLVLRTSSDSRVRPTGHLAREGYFE